MRPALRLGATRQVLRPKMGLLQHYLVAAPTTSLVPCLQRYCRLVVPRCPGVAQIVPAKILNAGSLKRFSPRTCVHFD